METRELSLSFDIKNGSRTGLVRRNRIRSAWEPESVALVIANSLEGDARARGLLECTIRITKPVREPKKLRFSDTYWFLRQIKCVPLLYQLHLSFSTGSTQKAKVYLCSVSQNRSFGRPSLMHAHNTLWLACLSSCSNAPIWSSRLYNKSFKPCTRAANYVEIITSPKGEQQ